MTEPTWVVAAKNLEWLLKNREGVHVLWDQQLLLVGATKTSILELTKAGFTPATDNPDPKQPIWDV